MSGITRTWRDPSVFLRGLFVDENCLDHPNTKAICSRAGLPVQVIGAGEQPDVSEKSFPESLKEGKRYLYLRRHQGSFFKPCPATRAYRCCDYHVLNIGMNCPIDCTYCILQAYLNNPWLSYYVNVEDMLAEIEDALRADGERRFRIGTGEFTDSLAIDRLTRLSEQLVPFVADFANAVLELKTKSGYVDNLQGLTHGGKTVVSWSLNSEQVLAREELRAATLAERLEAAKKCWQWGYRLAFHFDPIILHDGWQEGYRRTIEQLYRAIPAEAIVWISLGGLRYLPSLKEIGKQRFPGSTIFTQEFVPGLDGKQRYFRSQRAEMYSYIYKLLQERAATGTCIYFCMESDEIWQEVMGFCPGDRGGLGTMLDHAVFGQR